MINLHPGQSDVFRDLFIEQKYRYVTVCASRGWGKSYFAAAAARTALDELFYLDYSVPNKVVYINAATLDQVKDIYYPILAYDFGLESIAVSSSRERGRFTLPNNVHLRLMSFENIERMRGKGAYFVINDELASWSSQSAKIKNAWNRVIKPCITTRWSPKKAKYFKAKSPGRGLTISTPSGYNYFYDMYNFHEEDPLWGSYHYDYTESPLLDPSEIEHDRNTMTDIEFASEYLALFKESGLLVFYCFDRKTHAVDLEPLNPETEDVHIGIDFNVGIQASAVFALRNKTMEFVDEIKGAPNTEELAAHIAEKYKKHKENGHYIYAYPDPTGRARKSSAPVGQTDLSILEAAGIIVRSRKNSPPLIDSSKAVNRKLKTGTNIISMYFDKKKCPNTIMSMERTSWVEGDTALIDKSEGIEHFSDAVRYPTEYLFSITNVGKRTSRGFSF